VNVIAPLVTNASGLLRQTIYYPYRWALEFAHGNVLNLLVESPTYEVSGVGRVPYLDVAATLHPETGGISMFVLNRDLNKSQTVEIHWQDRAPNRLLGSTVLTGGDLKAVNTFEAPLRVAPQPADKPVTSGERTRLELPARSYTVIQWAS
jgi:alpha-N-arabinofuranosidase